MVHQNKARLVLDELFHAGFSANKLRFFQIALAERLNEPAPKKRRLDRLLHLLARHRNHFFIFKLFDNCFQFTAPG